MTGASAPFTIMNKIWLKTREELLQSLVADESKNNAILRELGRTISQLQAKSNFRLALINQLIEESTNEDNRDSKKTTTYRD